MPRAKDREDPGTSSLLFSIFSFGVPLKIVIWIDDTFDNDLGFKNDFTKYLKEVSC